MKLVKYITYIFILCRSIDLFAQENYDWLTCIYSLNLADPKSATDYHGLGVVRSKLSSLDLAILAIDVRKKGREVRSSPQSQPVKNPYHASIFLPKDTDQQKQKEHAKELAKNSKWYYKPT